MTNSLIVDQSLNHIKELFKMLQDEKPKSHARNDALADALEWIEKHTAAPDACIKPTLDKDACVKQNADDVIQGEISDNEAIGSYLHSMNAIRRIIQKHVTMGVKEKFDFDVETANAAQEIISANPSLEDGYYLPKEHPDHPFPAKSELRIIKMLLWELEQMQKQYASDPKIGMNAMHLRVAQTIGEANMAIRVMGASSTQGDSRCQDGSSPSSPANNGYSRKCNFPITAWKGFYEGNEKLSNGDYCEEELFAAGFERGQWFALNADALIDIIGVLHHKKTFHDDKYKNGYIGGLFDAINAIRNEASMTASYVEGYHLTKGHSEIRYNEEWLSHVEETAKLDDWHLKLVGSDIRMLCNLARRYQAATREPVSRDLEVLKNVVRFADGRCWPEVQAAIDANRSIL